MIRIALALAIFATQTAPAAADPASIVAGVVVGLLANAGVAAAVLNIVAYAVYIGTFVAIGYGVQALNQPKKIDPGRAKETYEASEASEIRLVGRGRLGGLIAFGSTNATNRYRLVLQARALDGVEDHFVGGFEVILDPSTGAVLSKPYRISGTNYIFIKSDLGDPAKTAWSDLVTEFPALWTSNHRARGIAQALIRYVSPGLTSARFLRLYQNGIPEYNVVARGERLYDPREGGHDPDDPTTWAWSDNGILAILHVAISFTRFTFDDFDLAQIADAADDADASVTTLTGSEPRARAWGVWASEGAMADTLSQLMTSVGAEFFTTDDDLIGIRLIDDARTEELTIAGRHVVSLDWRSGPESVERPNRLRLKYYSPERRYEMAEIDLSGQDWARVDSEITAVGEQFLDIDLPFCPSASQAQRIGRRLFAMARADRGVAMTNMVGMAAWGLRVVDIEVPDLETTLRCAILPPRARDGDGTVEIPFLVVPELATWNAATMEAAAPVDVPEIVYAGAADAPVAPSSPAVVVTYPDASIETRIAVTLPGGIFGITIAAYEMAYRTHNPHPSAWGQMLAHDAVTVRFMYLSDGSLLGIPSEFRLRGSNADDENTAWSPSLLETPAAVNTAPAVATIVFDSIGALGIVVTAPATLHVAYVRVGTPGGGFTNYPVRPLQVINFVSPASGTWTVTAHSSNGTASSSASAVAP